MVIHHRQPARAGGFLMLELVVAMAILVLAVMPLAYTVKAEANLFRATYQRAIAMEIVDGEMEILAAGEGRAFPEGTHAYTIHAHAAHNLPPGNFELTRTGNHLRLEWSATERVAIGKISREATVK